MIMSMKLGVAFTTLLHAEEPETWLLLYREPIEETQRWSVFNAWAVKSIATILDSFTPPLTLLFSARPMTVETNHTINPNASRNYIPNSSNTTTVRCRTLNHCVACQISTCPHLLVAVERCYHRNIQSHLKSPTHQNIDTKKE
ncbi:hypothetical protein GE09DRAFT_603883 [Coniochaeta sp. 2T2.1]|nr:hypothetical protein GE09DRAFT_603883 [Coniochaeta sp. 2T2.1]